MIIAKWGERIVEIVKFQHVVFFSPERDWILIRFEIGRESGLPSMRWIPAATRFEWVRDFNFGALTWKRET